MKDKANKGYWQRLAKIYAPLMESDKKFYNAICGYIRDYLKSDMNAVTVSFDGADMTTTILDVIECSSSSTFETALNATFGKHKAKEGVSAWIILDVMGGVGKGALIKK